MSTDLEQERTEATKLRVSAPTSGESLWDWRRPHRLTSPPFPSIPSVIILILLWFATAALSAAETPKRGGTLRLWNAADWRSFDPAIAFDQYASPFQTLLFRGLLDYDASGTQLVPDQASDWNISPDGKIYTFHLKPGAKFAHGREVEAEDYVFSLERVLDPKTGSPGQSYFLGIAGAPEFVGLRKRGQAAHVAGLRAPDPRTLVIELAKPDFTFRYVLAMPFAFVLPREVVRQHGADFQYHLIGSGPYRVTEWRRDVRWRFERNPHYSGTDGWVDAVEIMLGGNDWLGVMRVERGELDRVPADAVSALRFGRDPRLRSWLHKVSPVRTGYLFLNTEVKPFDDVRVRRAVSHAIDKQRLIKFAGGQAIVANGVVPPSMPWSNPGLPNYEYSPDKARALLREAGLPDGFKTQLWFLSARTIDKRMAEGIQQDLHAVGIELELTGVSQSAFEVKVRTRREAPCGIWGWGQDYPDPSNFLDVLFNGDRITDQDCNNVAFYNSPEVNRRLAVAGDSLDSGERLRLYREIEAMVLRDAPWVPLYHDQIPVIRNPRLHGDVPHPVWLWRYEHMWLEP